MRDSKELLELATEGLSASEYQKFVISMEADGPKLDIHKAFLQKITGQLTALFKTNKSLQERIFSKDILNTNGDVRKYKSMSTTLDVLKVLGKSKNKEVKARVATLNAFYQELVKRDKQWLRIKAKMNSDSLYEKTAAMLLFATFSIHINIFVEAVSELAASTLQNESKLSSKKYDMLQSVMADYKKGTVDKCLEYVVKNYAEEAVAVLVVLGLVVAMITLFFGLRVLVYYFYYTRMQIADYFEQQAQFLNLHKSEIKKNNDLTAVERDSIINAQRAWADRFMEISEMIADDELRAIKKAKVSVKEGNKELNPRNEIDVPNTGLDFF